MSLTRKIPYSHQSIDEDDIRAVVEVMKSGWMTQGPKIAEFEAALCAYTGSRYAVAVSNGTTALHLACVAADVRKGDEVITTPLTFAASANCVLYCGGTPVFCDVDEASANIDIKEIAEKISAKTRAIIPVHFAGTVCDMKEIARLADKNGTLVIEDACHALGAEYEVDGKWYKVGCGEHSDMTIFSFHPVKSIATAEGGAILTNRQDIYEQLMVLRTHGITKDPSRIRNPHDEPIGEWYYEMQTLGYNYRLTDLQSALGISQMKKLDKFIERRRRIVGLYNTAFAGNPYFDIPPVAGNSRSSCHLYPIRLKNKILRPSVFKRLRDAGLGVQVHYIPVHWQPYYVDLGFKKGQFPKAEDFYLREISIPMYPGMMDEDVRHVVKTILEICAEAYRG